MESHDLVSVRKGIDGQMGVKLRNKVNDFKIGILGLYLPPDSYKFGQDPEFFFNQASSVWDDFIDCDLLVGAGDLNARIKTDLDFLPDFDGHIPPRSNPDNVKNAHGGHFLTFLRGNRCVV